MPRKKLTPQQAKALLIADGVDFSQDFHSQDRYVVGRLEELAKAAGYRKSKNAPGSTVRMFYQYLSRVAPVERGAGQLTPAERRAYQERARNKKTPAPVHHATKKSPAQLQREIDEALATPAGAGASSAFEGAKAELALIEKEMAAAEAAMRAFPRGAMGLPPESVRLSPEYRAAKARTDKAFARLRAFNAVYVKRFAKELRAERAKRYGSR